MTGAYVLVDGGYVKYAQLMAPFKTTTDAAKALWSKRLESVRKEVEALLVDVAASAEQRLKRGDRIAELSA